MGTYFGLEIFWFLGILVWDIFVWDILLRGHFDLWAFLFRVVLTPIQSVTVLIVSATVTNLQQKLEGLQTANTLMKEDIHIAKSNIVQLQQENLNLRRDKEMLLDEHHRQMQVA